MNEVTLVGSKKKEINDTVKISQALLSAPKWTSVLDTCHFIVSTAEEINNLVSKQWSEN